MEHSEECKAYYQKLNDAIKEYEKQWPNYCRTCGGSGSLHSYQSVPYGMGSVNMDVYDACSCVEDGNCPRCGTHFDPDQHEDFFAGENDCPVCGQDLKKPDTCPYIDGPCECFYKEIEEY